MKKEYKGFIGGHAVSRKSDREYTHAVVYLRSDGTKAIGLNFCGSHENAMKKWAEQCKHSGYPSNTLYVIDVEPA